MASVRDAFFNQIYECVKAGDDIYIITADLGAPSLDDFRKDFPERYISVGIAEQNLVTIAAGLALGGKKVIAYGLNPFPVTRAFDQVRSLMAELEIPVTLCALNAGLCSAECGYTHMPIEDMAMMRTLSNVKIMNPTDETIARKLAAETVVCNVPRFIRFDKSIAGTIYEEEDIDFERGFSIIGNKGQSKLGIITNGCYVKELNQWMQQSQNTDGIKLFDLYTLPVDEQALVDEIGKCQQMITIEENVLAGGLGSLLLEIMSDHEIMRPVKRMGLDTKKGYYHVFTNREYIRKDQFIDMDNIMKHIYSVLL